MACYVINLTYFVTNPYLVEIQKGIMYLKYISNNIFIN